MKRYLAGLSLIILTTLLLVIGFRLSEDAVAVIVGIILGVVATLPTSLVLIYMIMRRDQSPTGQQQAGFPNHHQPPVIIVNGGQQPGLPTGSAAQPGYPLSLPSPRTFTIIGEETTEV
jgi:uncharacterized SAM-binding protein YcdF (DUF218 family)